MSTFAAVLADPSTSVQAEGILNLIQVKSNETLVTVRVLGSLLGAVVAIYLAAKARFAVGGILMGILMGGLIVWGVFNVDKVKESVDQEIDTGNTGTVSAPVPHDLTPIDLTVPVQL